MRLRPGTHLLWRHEGASQVYADPKYAVVLEGLSTPEQTLLDGLEQESSEAELVRRGRRLGIDAARVRQLLTALAACGAIQTTPRDPALDHRGLTGDVEHWSRASRGDAGPLLHRRAASTVAVLGLDRLGLVLAGVLAAAGVGTLLVDDRRRVRRDEVGAGGYQLADVGQVRGERARAALRVQHPHLRISAPPRTRPDLVVLVEQDVSDPVRLRPLVREDIRHLLVVVREADVVLGPLVSPGRGPCGRCLDLHRTAQDPHWPALATQLLGAAPRGVESSLATVTAGLAAAQVLAHLDGRPVATAATSLLVDARRPIPQTQQWSVHPDCGCSTLPSRAAGRRPAGSTALPSREPVEAPIAR